MCLLIVVHVQVYDEHEHSSQAVCKAAGWTLIVIAEHEMFLLHVVCAQWGSLNCTRKEYPIPWNSSIGIGLVC